MSCGPVVVNDKDTCKKDDAFEIPGSLDIHEHDACRFSHGVTEYTEVFLRELCGFVRYPALSDALDGSFGTLMTLQVVVVLRACCGERQGCV